MFAIWSFWAGWPLIAMVWYDRVDLMFIFHCSKKTQSQSSDTTKSHMLRMQQFTPCTFPCQLLLVSHQHVVLLPFTRAMSVMVISHVYLTTIMVISPVYMTPVMVISHVYMTTSHGYFPCLHDTSHGYFSCLHDNSHGYFSCLHDNHHGYFSSLHDNSHGYFSSLHDNNLIIYCYSADSFSDLTFLTSGSALSGIADLLLTVDPLLSHDNIILLLAVSFPFLKYKSGNH